VDSLTQCVLGACTAALVVPARHRRRALAAGAAIATLPDLDVLPLAWLADDPVTEVTWHRGPSHSLLVLMPVAWLIWYGLERAWQPVREAPVRWLWAVLLALLTHPVLDAFTVYGTQLWWPLPGRPLMWSSIFIIDPLYTVPLLLGTLVAALAGARRLGRRGVVAGITVSSFYLASSVVGKLVVEADASEALLAARLDDAPRFSTPTPLNTLLWRVVVLTADGYLVGDRSLAADRRPMVFERFKSDTAALAEVADFPAVRRLRWFTRGFVKAEERDGRLLLSDLRMGLEPDYTFVYAVARRGADGAWEPIEPERVGERQVDPAQLAVLWRRIWTEPGPGTTVVPLSGQREQAPARR
jgi:inner membrane protein